MNSPEEATIRSWRNRAKSRGNQQLFMFLDFNLLLFITNCPMSFSLFIFNANWSLYCSDDISSSKVVSSNKQREIGFRPDYQDKSLPKPSPRFFFGKERYLGSQWFSSTRTNIVFSQNDQIWFNVSNS